MRAIAAGVVIGALVGGAIVPSQRASAQPSAPDIARAKDLYKAAEEAMKDGRFADAAQDYGGAYEITRDPILFFKIGSANEKAGNCKLALIYFGRYLREGRPSESFQTMTKDHIRACGGDPDAPAPAAGSGSATGSATTPMTGSNTGSDTGPMTGSNTGTHTGATTGSDWGATGGSSTGVTTGSDTGVTTGSGTVTATTTVVHPHSSNKAAWALTATSIAFVTIGAVLAYSASSAENDIDDLYQGVNGPPAWDARTMSKYQDLVDEGNRYEKLSWVSFGLAGATGIAAAVLFIRGSHHDETSVVVQPTVTPNGAGASAHWRF
jgi:hypothetical protein